MAGMCFQGSFVPFVPFVSFVFFVVRDTSAARAGGDVGAAAD
jgi:hypothetical protein